MASPSEQRRERLNQYAHMATLGLMLVGVYEASPFLFGEMDSTAQLRIGESVGRDIDHIPWVWVSSGLSLIPFIAESTKRIPKAVGVPNIVRGSWLVPIGQTYRNRWVYHDFSGVIPHAIVAGSTKYGKTAMIRMCLYVLCQQIDPDQLEIVIIDLKGGSFPEWRNIPHVKSIHSTVEEAANVLLWAQEEMNRRNKLVDTELANFRPRPRFKRLLIAIDEGMRLADEADIQKVIRDIASVGREPNVNLLYGTQRPSHEILPTTTRDQMEARFAFKLREPGSSEIVLGPDNLDAYNLKARPGRMIYRGVDGQVELQAAYVDRDAVIEWCRTYYDEDNPTPPVTVDDGMSDVDVALGWGR